MFAASRRSPMGSLVTSQNRTEDLQVGQVWGLEKSSTFALAFAPHRGQNRTTGSVDVMTNLGFWVRISLCDDTREKVMSQAFEA